MAGLRQRKATAYAQEYISVQPGRANGSTVVDGSRATERGGAGSFDAMRMDHRRGDVKVHPRRVAPQPEESPLRTGT